MMIFFSFAIFIRLAGQNATFEIQLEEKAGNITWLKDNKPLDDRLADRISTEELPGNYFTLEIKHCWYVLRVAFL